MGIDFCKLQVRGAVAALVKRPTDIASLAVFRIFFGLLMAGAMVRFLAKGWVRELYTGPAFHFAYPGFEWIRPWPDTLMHAHFILLALLAIGIAAGFFYRVCIVLFFLGFTYVELIDQTAYLNHYYLISLLSGIMIFLPANRAWSVDVWRQPEIAATAAPAWCLNLLRFQIGVVYFFAGLAKFNADWLLRAEPLRLWLAARSELPLIGPLLGEPWAAFAASWFGAVFDVSIVFFLLCRKTRRAAYAFVILFHVATWILFNIGMFPWIMIVAATVFFAPQWPRDFLARIAMIVSKLSGDFSERLQAAPAIESRSGAWPRRTSPLLLPVLGLYVAVQLWLPLRPYFASEPPAWTGAQFNCAWQVMIVEKTGYAEFHAFDPISGQRWRLFPRDCLTPRQEVMMAQDPYLIRLMARHFADEWRRAGFPQIQIKVNAFATLNGRPSQQLIDPESDLPNARGTHWIVSLAR